MILICLCFVAICLNIFHPLHCRQAGGTAGFASKQLGGCNHSHFLYEIMQRAGSGG